MPIRDETVTLMTQIIQHANRGKFPYNTMVVLELLDHDTLEKMERLLSQYQDLSLLTMNKYILIRIDEIDSNEKRNEENFFQTLLAKDKKEKQSALFAHFFRSSIQATLSSRLNFGNRSSFISGIMSHMVYCLSCIKYFDLCTLFDQVLIKIALNNTSSSVKELLERESHGLPMSAHFMTYAMKKHALDKELSDIPSLFYNLKLSLTLDIFLLKKMEASPKDVIEGILYECFSSYKGLFDIHTRVQSHSEILKGLHQQLDKLHATPSDTVEPEEERRVSTGLGQ